MRIVSDTDTDQDDAQSEDKDRRILLPRESFAAIAALFLTSTTDPTLNVTQSSPAQHVHLQLLLPCEA